MKASHNQIRYHTFNCLEKGSLETLSPPGGRLQYEIWLRPHRGPKLRHIPGTGVSLSGNVFDSLMKWIQDDTVVTAVPPFIRKVTSYSQ